MVWFSVSQSVVFRPAATASLGTLLRTQILEPQTRPSRPAIPRSWEPATHVEQGLHVAGTPAQVWARLVYLLMTISLIQNYKGLKIHLLFYPTSSFLRIDFRFWKKFRGHTHACVQWYGHEFYTRWKLRRSGGPVELWWTQWGHTHGECLSFLVMSRVYIRCKDTWVMLVKGKSPAQQCIIGCSAIVSVDGGNMYTQTH